VSGPSLYVHVPFCETKCPYCDFNSFAVAGRDVDGYLDALLRECAARGVPRDPATIFIGGGTPTVVEPRQLERALAGLLAGVAPDPSREFTVEANPGSLTAEKVAILRAFGVNRLSIGAQSFLDRHLRALGRVHSAAQIDEAYRLAREGGIAQVNLDFIFAVPGLTAREWAGTLERATALGPDHLSCYALIFEPGTEFFARRAAGRMRPVDERLELAMFRLTERVLRQRGYRRYEISNFARPGRECRHNLVYWRNGSYLGVGAGAHSYLGGERLANEKNLSRYAGAVMRQGHAIVSRERLSASGAAREAVVLGLRTADGIDLEAVARRYGIDADREFGAAVRRMRDGGFLEPTGPLRLARKGWRVADEVMSALV